MSSLSQVLHVTKITPYVEHLESLAQDLSWFEDTKDSLEEIDRALNGELSKTLRDHISLKILQDYGAFFTPEDMAQDLISPIITEIQQGSSVLDPACGGGNLLLAFAKHLPLAPTLTGTLESWGQLIYGFDLHEEFVRATRARLALLAIKRGNFHNDHVLKPLEELFFNIKKANSLDQNWPNVDFVVMNPPFNRIVLGKNNNWASGKVSLAAIFMIHCINQPTSSRVLAILPDVLRSGTRYKKWRSIIEQTYFPSDDPKILGKFDSETNVDVFSLNLNKKSFLQDGNHIWKIQRETACASISRLGEKYKVSVGPVVPHRHPKEGPEYAFLDVNNIIPWQEINIDTHHHKRCFKGSVQQPPFIVIKRNSRSDDKHRTVATLITGDKSSKVAVENHLIIVKPISESLEDCIKLFDILKRQTTSDWINSEIRCRHLTVSAVESIPLE